MIPKYMQVGLGRKPHGMTGKRVYCSWQSMRGRCYNTTDTAYRYYGGRGITICKRWNSFLNFLADMGDRPAGKYLDRINTNGNYTPKNCRWATWSEQQNNTRRTVKYRLNGVIKPVAVWARETGVPRRLIKNRIMVLGWSVCKAITSPVCRKSA